MIWTWVVLVTTSLWKDKVSALPASVTSGRVGQLIDISIIFLWVST